MTQSVLAVTQTIYGSINGNLIDKSDNEFSGFSLLNVLCLLGHTVLVCY